MAPLSPPGTPGPRVGVLQGNVLLFREFTFPDLTRELGSLWVTQGCQVSHRWRGSGWEVWMMKQILAGALTPSGSPGVPGPGCL